MRTTTGSVQNNPQQASTPAYPPPSVPISIYRELAAQLQTTEAKLELLNGKNKQLIQENQLLRQEISQVVQAFLHLQKLVDPQDVPNVPGITSDRLPSSASSDVKGATKQPVPGATPRQQASRRRPPVDPKVSSNKNRREQVSVHIVEEIISPIPEPVLIEEQEVSYYSPREPKSYEISGWWLVITILLIMLTAFGAGYLVVRPMFEHHSR